MQLRRGREMEGAAGPGEDRAAPSGHLSHLRILRPRPPPADAGGGAQRAGDSNAHSSERTLAQREKAKVDLTEVIRGWRGRERDEEAKPGWVTPRRACLGLRCGSVWSVCVRLGEGPGLRTKTLGAPTATSAKAALVRKPVCRSRASAPWKAEGSHVQEKEEAGWFIRRRRKSGREKEAVASRGLCPQRACRSPWHPLCANGGRGPRPQRLLCGVATRSLRLCFLPLV